MSIEREIELLAVQEDTRGKLSARARSVLAWRRERRLLDAYATVFFGSADSETLTPEAVLVLNDLGRLAGIGRVRIMGTDAELRVSEGQRHVVLHIMNQLRGTGRKLARMARQIRETET